MGAIGLAEAARLTGRNQSSIHRAMKAGRLAYSINEAGERRIEIAELERVFGINPSAVEGFGHGSGASPGNDAAPDARKITHGGELAALQQLLEDRERTIADLRDSIRDYRDRLDAEAEERRRIQERLTGLLTRPPETRPASPEGGERSPPVSDAAPRRSRRNESTGPTSSSRPNSPTPARPRRSAAPTRRRCAPTSS